MNNRIQDLSIKKLLISNTLFSWGVLITQIFLNIFLFKATNDIKLVAMFNIISLTTHLFSFSFFARIVKYWYRNLLHCISLLWLCLVYSWIIIMWEKISNYSTLLWLWIWFFSWMYWIIYTNNEFDNTTNSNRWNVWWLKKSLKSIISIIIPSLVWIIIWINYMWYWYEISFWIWILLFLLSWIIWIIKVDYHTWWKYSAIWAFKKIYSNKELFKSVFNSMLLGFSLSNNLISIVLPLFLYSYWIVEANVGFLISAFSILTIIITYIFWKYVPYNKYKMIYILACFIYVLSVIILIFFPSKLFAVLFSSILNLLFTFLIIPQWVFGSNLFNNMKWFKSIKSEYMVIREWPLMAWRISSFILIYFIWDLSGKSVWIIFIVMSLVILLSAYLFNSIKIEHK